MHVVGYVRGSTEEPEQGGNAIAIQRLAIALECEQRGWLLGNVYEDTGGSGQALEHRPGLQAAIEHLDRGWAAALVVAKLDRLSRSLLDFVDLMERSHRAGWSLVAIDLGVDSTTADGQLLANVMTSFVQFERQLIGLRTKEALAEKKRNGIRLGRPRSLLPEVRAKILQMRERGSSLAGIVASLNEDQTPTAHGGKWHATTIRRVLMDGKS